MLTPTPNNIKTEFKFCLIPHPDPGSKNFRVCSKPITCNALNVYYFAQRMKESNFQMPFPTPSSFYCKNVKLETKLSIQYVNAEIVQSSIGILYETCALQQGHLLAPCLVISQCFTYRRVAKFGNFSLLFFILKAYLVWPIRLAIQKELRLRPKRGVKPYFLCESGCNNEGYQGTSL